MYKSVRLHLVGERFSSAEKFEMKLKAYKRQIFVKFWKCDLRAIL